MTEQKPRNSEPKFLGEPISSWPGLILAGLVAPFVGAAIVIAGLVLAFTLVVGVVWIVVSIWGP